MFCGCKGPEGHLSMKAQETKIEAKARRKKKRAAFFRDVVRDRHLYLILLPFLIYYALFIYKPMGGLVIAFQKYSLFKGIAGSKWVGLQNFKTFFNGPYFWRTLKNTLGLNLYLLVFSFPAPIIFAILLNEVRRERLKKTIQTMSYMPYFISTVVVVGIVTNLLSPSHGLITALVRKITGETPYFLMMPQYFRPIYTIMSIWQNLGYSSVIYFAALTGVDTQLYEAAAIDGAGKWKQIWHVTLPGIMPTIMIMLILRIGELMSDSTNTILLLYQPSTYEVSDVIGTYVYRAGLGEGNFSLATAVGLFNSVVSLILVLSANAASKKLTQEGIW